MLGIALWPPWPISSDIVLSRLARLARPVSESCAAACASSRCKVRASVKSWNTMTEPLNSPLSLRIGETTSRMLQREPSLRDSTARLLCSTRCLSAAKHRGAGDLLAAFLVDRRVDLVERAPMRLFRGGAGQLLGGRIHEGDAGRRVGADDGVADRIQGDAQALLLVGQHRHRDRKALFGLLALGDVGQAADRPDQLPVLVALERLAAIEDPDPVPVLVAHPELGLEERRLALEMGAVGIGHDLLVVRMDHRQPAVGVAVELALFVAEHLHPGGGIGRAALAHIHVPHALAGAGQREIPARFGFGDARLGLLARVDVLDLRDEMERCAGLAVANDGAGKTGPHRRAVLAADSASRSGRNPPRPRARAASFRGRSATSSGCVIWKKVSASISARE